MSTNITLFSSILVKAHDKARDKGEEDSLHGIAVGRQSILLIGEAGFFSGIKYVCQIPVRRDTIPSPKAYQQETLADL